MGKPIPLYQVGDLVMIRSDIHEDFCNEHYEDDCLDIPEELLVYKGKVTKITKIDPDYENKVWYRTELRHLYDEEDLGEAWFLDCTLIPVKDLPTLNQALLNGQIDVVAYEQAKQKLGEVNGI